MSLRIQAIRISGADCTSTLSRTAVLASASWVRRFSIFLRTIWSWRSFSSTAAFWRRTLSDFVATPGPAEEPSPPPSADGGAGPFLHV